MSMSVLFVQHILKPTADQSALQNKYNRQKNSPSGDLKLSQKPEKTGGP